MTKKIAVILIVISLSGSIVFLLTREQKPVIRDTLSERSKEYLKDRKTNTDSSLQNAVIDEEKVKSVLRNEEVTVGDCFQIMIPFKVWNARKEGACSMYYAIDNPRGQIVVYQEKGTIESFDAVPGVSMRRKFPEAYKEETKVVNGKTFLLFRRDQEAYETNVFYFTPDSYFVLNLLSTSSENLDQKLFLMLESLKFK